jgi:hypothetical protein
LVNEEDRALIEEHAIAERRGMLGGRSIRLNRNGELERTSWVLACDFCGLFPLRELVVCRKCKARLCEDCTNWLDGRPYDRACLMEILPVSVNSYKTLICLEAGIESPSKISELTRISKEDVKASLAHLKELKLVEAKGMLAFLERKLTADGVRALAVYRKVYGNDDDVLEVERKLPEEHEDGN